MGPLLLVAAGLTRAARRHPGINATWDAANAEIVTKHYVNLGIAAATPRGLLVPNIKDAQDLGMKDLARALNRLTLTAREGKTPPADQQGGTITITNIGVFGMEDVYKRQHQKSPTVRPQPKPLVIHAVNHSRKPLIRKPIRPNVMM